ncbi:MAG: methyl-accepting chemotaxis protein, partial [Desulfuromonadales bacterium]|nr:methyl-accepting chemotaxis protein [Desulfuromonadales bacterium]
MILFFLTASFSIMAITAIIQFLDLNGTPLTGLTFSGNHFSGAAHLAIPLLILLYLSGIALLVWLMSITTSLNRSLEACADFARAIDDNRPDARLSIKVPREAAGLCSVLNDMAENLHNRFSIINSICGTLVSVDSSLDTILHQVAQSVRIHGSAIAQATPAMDCMKISTKNIYECSDLLEHSTTSTVDATRELTATLQRLASSSDNLGASFDEVSLSTAEMAASIREIDSSIVNLLEASSATASSVAQLDVSIRQVEKIALDTSTISAEVKNDAETGKRAVEEAIAGMQAIRTSSRITSEAMQNLSRRVDDIGVILSVIEEVAEQTDLLALNATIIAAQAGVHGKGFSVVADEIRELAERTSSSTREISMVIRGVQNETRRAMDAIQQAEKCISAGQKLSQHSGRALEKIVNGVQQANTEVRKIARTTVEQARGSQVIRESMQSVAEMVQRIAAASTEHTQTSAQ